MFGSELLNIAIGLIFIYLVLSLICSAINEIIEAWLKRRATDLERGIRELLHDKAGTGLATKLYNHPLVHGLFQGGYSATNIKNDRYQARNLPSYIPARNFALALMDIVLPATPNTPGGAAGAATAPPSPAPGAPAANSLAPLRKAIGTIGNPKVEAALLALVDAAGHDVSKARENIEAWYDSAMDRVAGWYKRRAQIIIFCLGLGVAIAVNADTIGISTSISRDKAVRDSLVAAAQEYARKQADTDDPAQRVKQNVEEIRKLGLPIGWTKDNPLSRPGTPLGWAIKVTGWLLTAMAISLGAAFWFDLLNKFMVIRSTVKPHEKSPEEASAG
jgi:hypothetical protein